MTAAAVYVVLTDHAYEPSNVEAVTSDLDLAKMIAEAEGLAYTSANERATATEWREYRNPHGEAESWHFSTGSYGDGGMRVERHEVIH